MAPAYYGSGSRRVPVGAPGDIAELQEFQNFIAPPTFEALPKVMKF
jgi:hypothetical protein